jgi:hypothetical protein
MVRDVGVVRGGRELVVVFKELACDSEHCPLPYSLPSCNLLATSALTQKIF